MILCAALFEGINSLLPVYVREVLDENPANSIYIFAPAGIGYLIGAVGGPRLIHRFGERRLNREDDFPGARTLAERLVTLPVHSQLRPDDVAALEQWITRLGECKEP